MADEPEPAEDVGAEGGALRLWGAREAVTQGYRALDEIDKSMNSLGGSATAILGWSVTLTTALTAAAATETVKPNLRVAAAAGAVFALTAAGFCCLVIQPRKWKLAAPDPQWISDDTYNRHSEHRTELAVVEAIAGGTLDAITRNSAVMIKSSRLLTCAWIAFLLVPLSAIAILLWPHFATLLRAISRDAG